MSYANITNPANFQLQDFAQFGFRVITTDFIPVPGEQYRTLYVLQDAVVTATTQKGDDITSKAILAGTLLHGLFNSVSITSGRVLAYAAGRVTADEIIALYEAYVVALGGTLENTQCAIDTLNDTGVDFFADASLVMIPEGYGTGVVYGQRPLTSDSQLTFTRASTATRVGPDGAIAVVGSNVPRIDYTGGGCGKLLLEPQRTNEMPYSEYLLGWTIFTNIAITQNQTTSPQGITNGVLMARSGSGDLSGGVRYTGISITANSKCYSVFAKANAHNFIQLYHSGDAQGYVNFDISTGAVGTSGSKATGTIESYGSGWYRCTAIYDSTNAFGSSYYIGFAASASAPYAGGAVPDTSSVYLYGVQLESSASYPSSYIPTSGAAVTRLADACSKTGISSLIGQTQGTLFVDFNWEQKDGVFFINSISDGTTSNDLFMAFGSSGNNLIRFSMNAGGINYVSTDSGVISSGRHKIAFAYKTNDVTAYIDGVQIFTDTSAIVPATSAFKFARSNDTLNFVSSINQQLLFRTRLTNEQLQKLTSL